jgi:hypothetical protein
MLGTILPGFSSGDFCVNEFGVITLCEFKAKDIALKLLGLPTAAYDHIEAVMLPVFEAILPNPGDIGAVSFIVKGKHLMVEGLIDRPENVRLLMALETSPAPGDGGWFTYTGTAAGLGDQKFTILDMSNNIFTGDLDPDATYRVLVVIKDGGAFDLDRQEDGTIFGAMAFISVHVTGITLAPSNVNLTVGGSFDFKPGVTFTPTFADYKEVLWSNNNYSIAEISSDGIYTAKGTGADTVRVMALDGGFWADVTVQVAP